MDTKICTKCGKELLLTEEYFYKVRRNSSKFMSQCKECIKNKSKEYVKNNKEIVYEKIKEYRGKRKDFFNEYVKGYYTKNKESITKYKKDYRDKNKDKISQRDRKYYTENKDRIIEQNREYKRKNKDRYNIMNQKRESMKKSLPATLTIEQWEQTKEYFNYRCAYCGRKLKLTQDHFIPIAKGGGLTKDNIVPACKSCNCSKQDSDFKDWYPKIKHYSKKREEAILKFLNIEN